MRDDWTHRLANLAPLYSRKNPAASNFEFRKEKEFYCFGKDSTISTFVLINNLREINEWTSEVLKDRQSDLPGRFYKHWELK
ncbi:DUF1524 domain-containing protein [Brucella pseudogrignonensis]|uniref:GmrSD restriction endonuclease domain-containing protein n=1 Tax=Brucella pseudogrignonensis TaxID=419475 RepID=UPI00385723FE